MTKLDYSISPKWVTILSFLVMIPLVILPLALFVFIWGWEWLDFGVDALFAHPITLVAVLISGVIAHELLHGLTWGWLSGDATCVQYSIQWKTLTADVRVIRPISSQAYVIGLILPAVVTGFLPLTMALAIGSGSLVMFGIIFTWYATKDMMIVWRLRDVDISVLIEDHPTRTGVYVYEADETDIPLNM